MASHHAQTFLNDADELLIFLSDRSVDRSTEDSRLELARTLHSLKSGAAFLGWDDVETEAHRLEDLLGSLGPGSFPWDQAGRDLDALIATRRIDARTFSKEPGIRSAVSFNDLDRKVLKDSRRRGEAFFRMTCRIDPSEPLPYPRAYLVASNLETAVTVVKTDPPMDDSDHDFSTVTIWFTSDVSENEIYNAANVDLVEVLHLTRLQYRDVLAEGTELVQEEPSSLEDEETLTIERRSLEGILQAVEELAWRLESRGGTAEQALCNELQRDLEGLAFRPLAPVLQELERGLLTLAERRGIEVEFENRVGYAGLDAESLDSVSEIVRQLMRNSLKHGIESPEDRISAGKDPQGHLVMSAEKDAEFCRFTFSDDGAGIDEDAVRRRAQEAGVLGEDESKNLLDILCAPGFSMATESDRDGGRGIGLEMVRHIVRGEFGGDVELENRPGKGVTLRWMVPEKRARRPYLVFQDDGSRWALPSSSVVRREVMDPENLDVTGQAYRIGGGLVPMVGPGGLRPPGITKPYVLEIRHRNRRAALVVDDLVAEEPWGPEDLKRSDPMGPWCRSLVDAKDGVPILSPTLVYAADGEPGR